jgi:SAM-dependent methyltransferase
VVAADSSSAYLERARQKIERLGLNKVEFVKADAYQLPFDDDSFDAVWCARSLISLRDPVAALREMRRVVRPAGVVAILEDDEFHRVLLNASVDLELELHRAIAESAKERFGSRAGLSPARRVFGFLREAGLRLERKRTFAADRIAPFDRAVVRYLRLYLRETRHELEQYLSAEDREALNRVLDAKNESSLFRREDAELTCLTTLFLARK